MGSLEELEQRVAAMEAELVVVRQEAAARALAAGADRDVADYRAELRGHTRVLSALRETQLEHYGEHKADAAEIKAGLTHIVRLLEGMGGATEPDGPTTGVLPNQAAVPVRAFREQGAATRGGTDLILEPR